MTWHDKTTQCLDENWRTYVKNLYKSLNDLEKDIDEAGKMADSCTKEWCEATEHVIDELANAIYSIHEPTFMRQEDSQIIKELRKKVHDLYFKYKSIGK